MEIFSSFKIFIIVRYLPILFIFVFTNIVSQEKINRDTLQIVNMSEADSSHIKERYFITKNFKHNFDKSNIFLQKNEILKKKSSWWVTPTEVISLNLLVGGYNTYVANETWAKISFRSIGENFSRTPVWDKDKFIINQFAHPFHGSQYFNIARSNGYSFWESVPFAFAGSAMWEWFMENDPPAYNDLISTTLGGIMLGEMSNKMSSALIDRKGRINLPTIFDMVGSFINIPRLINVSLFNAPPNYLKYYKQSDYDTVQSTRVLIGFSLGYQGKLLQPINNINQFFFNLYYTYNKGELKKPYDFFRFRGGFSYSYGQKELNSYLYAYGILKEFRLKIGYWGIFQDYDFIFNRQSYKIGAQSIGVGLLYKQRISKEINLNYSALRVNLIPLAAVNSPERQGPYRDYTFTCGVKGNLDLYIEFWNRLSTYLDLRLFYLKTINGIDGTHVIYSLSPKIILDCIKFEKFELGIGSEFVYNYRKSKYYFTADRPISFKNYSYEIRVFISIKSRRKNGKK
jgi:hypothetical protein